MPADEMPAGEDRAGDMLARRGYPGKAFPRIALLVVGCVVASAATPVRAQTWSPHLVAGLSSATFIGESDNDWGFRHSLAGGGGVTRWVSRYVGVRAELLYAIRGGVARDAVIDGAPTQLEARFSIAYVELPLVLVGRLPLDRFSPYAFAGAALARNVDARIMLISPTGQSQQESDDSIRSDERSVVGGIGAEFSVVGETLFVEARVTGGLFNIRPEREDAPLKNRSTLIVAGIRF